MNAPSTPTNALHVIFGTGPVGLAIMEELLARGRRVRLVNRSGRRPADAPQSVELRTADVTTSLDAARAAAEGATHVYNALNAADYHKWPEQFPPLYAGVLAAAEAAQARLIVVENVYMYGPTDGQPVRENLPYKGTGTRSGTRARLAEELLAAHKAGRIRVVMGRASDFYGPRVTESSAGQQQFEAAITGGKAQVLYSADHAHTYHYVPDVGRGLVTLAEDENAYGRAWHLPAAPAITTRAFLEQVYAAAGNPLALQIAPGWLLPLLGLVMPPLRGISERAYEHTADFIVDDSDFRRAYGDLATPIPQGIATTLAWYRAHHAAKSQKTA